MRVKIQPTMQDEYHYLPNTDRLSVLAASILLAYAMLPFIKFPERSLVLQILGVVFVFKVNFATIISLISAGLAAAGVSWLLVEHPRLKQIAVLQPTGGPAAPKVANSSGADSLVGGIRASASVRAIESDTRASFHFPGSYYFRSLFQHWLLPALTAWVIGVPLSSLTVGLQWWAVFAFGGLLLVLVLVAEYIAVDPNNTLYGPASIGLTAFSYALFLILTIALVAGGTRLYILLPALTGAILLVILRSLYLRLGGRWCFGWAIGITLVVAQVATALHYWPLSPLRFGLVILGLAYALASVAGAIEEGRSGNALWVEPAVMLVVLWGLAVVLHG
jgi:hypothetical protein